MYYFLFLIFCFSLGADPKVIGIIATDKNGVQPWDPDDLKTGITGAEEAIIYISKELVQLGYQVLVLGDPPPNSLYSRPDANPRYITHKDYEGTHFDIAILWRDLVSLKRWKQRSDKIYFWPHDIAIDPCTEAQIKELDDVLWLTEWQRQHWIHKNPCFTKFTKIFGNGIDPASFHPIEERRNPYSCIYASSYAQGLELLLDIWPSIKKRFPRATLDLYYGWKHWGILSPQTEKKMRSQVARFATLGVTEHGLVGHDELTKAYETASFWTYPCTRWETFCISALRAQAAGAIPVCLERTALKETVRHGYKCTTREAYFSTLVQALEHAEAIELADRAKMRDFILQDYTWKAIAAKWHTLFEGGENHSVSKSQP
ncbi:MAG TPA: glycosyltransferase family 4 protein [Chlamydiales bacterium]|nr:glycosyltransferase family 4 protein [Chlamydiales bacterium]